MHKKKIKGFRFDVDGVLCDAPLSFHVTNMSQNLTRAPSCFNARNVYGFAPKTLKSLVWSSELHRCDCSVNFEEFVACVLTIKAFCFHLQGIAVQEFTFNHPACLFYNLQLILSHCAILYDVFSYFCHNTMVPDIV